MRMTSSQSEETSRRFITTVVQSRSKIKPKETTRVRIGKTWEPAIVTAQHTAPRSYTVATPDGTAYRRNCRHLFPTDEPPPVTTGSALDEPVTPPVSVTSPVSASNVLTLPSQAHPTDHLIMPHS